MAPLRTALASNSRVIRPRSITHDAAGDVENELHILLDDQHGETVLCSAATPGCRRSLRRSRAGCLPRVRQGSAATVTRRGRVRAPAFVARRQTAYRRCGRANDSETRQEAKDAIDCMLLGFAGFRRPRQAQIFVSGQARKNSATLWNIADAEAGALVCGPLVTSRPSITILPPRAGRVRLWLSAASSCPCRCGRRSRSVSPSRNLNETPRNTGTSP